MSAAIGCVILAAGRSKRFGRANKLLSAVHGQALLWWTLDAACASTARPIVVVTGHERRHIEHSLRAYKKQHRHAPSFRIAFNPHYRRGMSSSLQTGLRRLPASSAGALIALGDMPALRSELIEALIRAWQPGDEAVQPVSLGKRGNPVLLSREIFPAVSELEGDQGARRLLQRSNRLKLVETREDIGFDVDRRRDLHRHGNPGLISCLLSARRSTSR